MIGLTRGIAAQATSLDSIPPLSFLDFLQVTFRGNNADETEDLSKTAEDLTCTNQVWRESSKGKEKERITGAEKIEDKNEDKIKNKN